MTTAANTYGRANDVPLTNKSGGGVVAGDVVIVDTTNNDSFTTTTSAAFTGLVGIAQDTIASNAVGRVRIGGYAALVNVNASVTRGHYGATHTVAKQAADAGASRTAGTFCQFLTGGTTPTATIFNPDLGTGGSTIITKDEGSTLSSSVTTLDFVGAGVTASGSGATTTVTVAGGGPTFGQAVPYPTTFSGDTINGSSATPFVDVVAFDTKEVLNSRILHLVTSGQSKDERVRVTLGTTKAGAFDVRIAFQVVGDFYSSAEDYYAEIRLSTSADAQIAIARLYPGIGASSGGGLTPYPFGMNVRPGGSSLSSANTAIEPFIPLGAAVTLQWVRDGSNVIVPSYGIGQAPMAMNRMMATTGRAAYTNTVSGTLARIEIAMHSPAGPTSGFIETYIDYVSSV
jgi:hypothetical protein